MLGEAVRGSAAVVMVFLPGVDWGGGGLPVFVVWATG